jgi:CIC family chloride channel protein
MNDDIPPRSNALTAGAGYPERAVSLVTLCLISLLVGAVAAAGALLFRVMISFTHNLLYVGTLSFSYDANHFDPPSPVGPLIILAPVIGGIAVVWLVKTFAPEAKGHGVPEVMFAVYHNNGDVRGIVAVIKSIASAISIGSGASVGREGPIIQIGASFGSTFARALRLPRWQKITLLSAGAGAGIAATFNTPLGGVLFAVELLLPEVSNRTFLPVVVATATATYIGRFVFGLAPAFHLPPVPDQPHLADGLVQLAGFAFLGIASGVASWAFVRLLAFCEDLFPRLPGNAYVQNAAGMLLVGLIGYGFLVTTGANHTSGVGYATIQSILDGGRYGVVLFCLLFAGKLIATTVSLGAGASGGVFSPSLFLGATLGGGVGALGAAIFPTAGFSAVAFAVVGMGAMVGGATGASMTAIVMIFEMTRDYTVIVPLVLAVAVATSMRRWLITDNIYTVKLRRRGRPIPTIRHTNMYLVQQARELMSKNFLVLPKTTPLAQAVASLNDKPGAQLIISHDRRIEGYARFRSLPYRLDGPADGTLDAVTATDFVVAPETEILNSIISRMSTRRRTFAIIVKNRSGIPRTDDVVGVIDSKEIADAVIRNHYS